MRGKLRRGKTVEPALRTPAVVRLTPMPDHCPDLIESEEQFAGEAFITQSTMETFHESVLPSTPRLNVRGTNFEEL